MTTTSKHIEPACTPDECTNRIVGSNFQFGKIDEFDYALGFEFILNGKRYM